jgi:hypothetical protein
MDELIIDERKYISSKRAAKITGYAKDYVGQLCREGYVEARRVGRSWYVLESAIKDHKFGAAHTDTAPISPVEAAMPLELPVGEEVTSAWEAPRYGAVEPSLPSINLLRKGGSETGWTIEKPAEGAGADEDFHEAWQTWFDTFRSADSSGTEPGPRASTRPDTEMPSRGQEQVYEVEKEEGVRVAIHPLEPVGREIVEKSDHKAPEAGILEMKIEDVMRHRHPYGEQKSQKKRSWAALTACVSVVIALISIVIAVIGSGSIKEESISSKQVQYLDGIIIYNK